MNKQLIFPMEEKYQEYLTDESKFTGFADSISFPETEQEIAEIIKELHKTGTPITIQSGKTGIVGGAVPLGGHIMNLSGMNQCIASKMQEDGTGLITVQPGINMVNLEQEINRIFKYDPMFWPPKPTEGTAAVGGVLASGANGIRAYHYGNSRQYVESVRLICADGTAQLLKRGEKDDELDLILGGEGLYGVITEAELRLVPKTEQLWGITFFFETLAEIGHFADTLPEIQVSEKAFIAAAEYIGREAINLIEQHKLNMTKIRELPDVREEYAGLVYLELMGSEEEIEDLAEQLMEQAAECGSDPDTAWAVIGEAEVEKMHAFRHAAAETSNLFIEAMRREDKRIAKLGTDIKQDGKLFSEVISAYEQDLKRMGLNGSIFGHIGGSHLHVNILPRDYKEYEKGKALICDWTGQNGDADTAAEHGLGKLKAHLVDLTIQAERQDAMKQLKEIYDPEHIWNRGNIFAESR